MDTISILSSFALSSVIFFIIYKMITSKIQPLSSSRRPPPGPFRLPIIGNLHQISKMPHQSFTEISKKYGPIISLQLGTKEVVVASSKSIAQEILQNNDLVCSSRSVPGVVRALPDHHKHHSAWLPVSDKHWRSIRKIYKEHMFSPNRLDSSQELRQEKLNELVDHINKCSERKMGIDIGEVAFLTTLNLMSRTLFSADFSSYEDSHGTREIKEVVEGLHRNYGTPNLSDFFPILGLFDPQGLVRGTRLYTEKLNGIIDEIVQERLKFRSEASSDATKNDLLEALLDEHMKNESHLSIEVLENIIAELFVAALDTTSGTVEWTMTELLRNPEKLELAREELKKVIGDKRVVQESDISKLPYLQAILKESFRIHPVGPLLIPHKAEEDVKINGYKVAKNTEILINIWAIGRDEKTWKNANMFLPERFLESKIDVKGRHFELIPFGSGRRMCPGFPLAYRMVHLMVASFVHNFEWKLEAGINLEEKFGLAVKKALPLRAIPVKLS